MPERSTRATPETRERRGDSYSLAHCLAHSRCLVSGYSISRASCSHQLPPNFPTPSIPPLVSCMGGHPPDLGPLCLTLPAVLPSWGPVSAQLASMPTPPRMSQPAQSTQLQANWGYFSSRPLLPGLGVAGVGGRRNQGP